MMVLAASDMRGAKVNKTKENMRGCKCKEHMSCAGLVLTTLNGFVIVGLEIVVVL